MKKLLFIFALMLAPVFVHAQPMEQSVEVMVWNETVAGKQLDTEIVPRLTFTDHKESHSGKFIIGHESKYYFGGGPYIGHDFATGTHREYGFSGYFGTKQEGTLSYYFNKNLLAVAGAGAETWLRYQSGYEIYAVPYVKAGFEYLGDGIKVSGGIRKPLAAYEIASNDATDGIYHLRPQTSSITPYGEVLFPFNKQTAVKLYYEGYNFGASPAAPNSGGIYQPHSTMNVVGVELYKLF